MQHIARKIAATLHDDLKANRIEKIDIHVIRTYIKKDEEAIAYSLTSNDAFEGAVTRAVVERC